MPKVDQNIHLLCVWFYQIFLHPKESDITFSYK